MGTTTLAAGDLIHGRYRLVRAVSAGEGSIVFEAEDTTLQRPVAVRVLLDDVLEDPAWREYVRHETTAVAALHHPNLTRIYDWGEEAGSLFVVTEFLAGGSLAEILATRGTLTLEQTALIGLEAATALAYAHAREFVHGALRPSKILFDAEGRVRVSGLGLDSSLRATRGYTARSLEDARYMSPEQVLGSTLEGRSDVYSLALILFECLTGHVPHAGRTLEATRTNRLGAALPHRPELGPLDLPLALAAAPEPAARPDADLFANRLAAVAATLPVPRPVTLSASNTGGFVAPSVDEVLSAPAVAVTGRTMTVGESELIRPLDRPGIREQVDEIAAHHVPEAAGKGLVGIGLILAIVLIVAGVAFGAAWKLGAFTPTYRVPDIVRDTPASALSRLATDDFSVRVIGTQHSNSIPAGEIITQDPKAGATLSRGASIEVVTSEGRALVTIPGVLTLGCHGAMQKLLAAGLSGTCPNAQQVYSLTVKVGAVVALYLGTAENPTTAPSGSTIVLVLSKGPPPTTTTTTTSTTTTTQPGTVLVAVPSLVGLDSAQTHAAMMAAKLWYVTVGPGAKTLTWTKVVSTDPPAGTMVPQYSTVTVTVTT